MSTSLTNTSKGIALLASARTALAEASTLDDVKQIRDKAEAIRMYVRSAGESLQVQNAAADIKLRAERKIGEMLRDMEKAKHRHSTGDTMSPVKLEELGVTKKQSSRWQLAASLPEEDYELLVLRAVSSGTELTQSLVLRAAKGLVSVEKEPQVTEEATISDTFDLVGDLRECIVAFIDKFGSERWQILHDVLCSEANVVKELINGCD